MDHERDAESLEEERRQLRGHQSGADDSDLLDRARLDVGDSDATFCPALDEVECVQRRAGLAREDEVGKRFGFGVVAVLDRRTRASELDQVERDVRRGRRSVDGVVHL